MSIEILDEERRAFGGYLEEGRLAEADGWTPIAIYEREHEDGREAIVSVRAFPFRFYRIQLAERSEPVRSAALTLVTGSGEAELAAVIAGSFADASLGVEGA